MTMVMQNRFRLDGSQWIILDVFIEYGSYTE